MDRGFIPSFGKGKGHKKWDTDQLKEQRNNGKIWAQSRKLQFKKVKQRKEIKYWKHHTDFFDILCIFGMKTTVCKNAVSCIRSWKKIILKQASTLETHLLLRTLR